MNTYAHYCTGPGFLGIIESGNLWAGTLRHMNDSMELKWTKKLIQQEIESWQASGKLTDLTSTTNAMLVQFIWEGAEWFAICLSHKVDQLSQWRGYADNGAGYCLELDPSVIASEAIVPWNDTTSKVGIVDIIYDHNQQMRIIREILASVNPDNATALHVALHRIFKLLPVFKNPSFVEESEVRILYWPDISYDGAAMTINGPHRDFGHRMTAHGPSLYFKIPFVRPLDKSALQRVWLGPKNPASERDVERLLAAHKYPCVEIKRSVSSYR